MKYRPQEPDAHRRSNDATIGTLIQRLIRAYGLEEKMHENRLQALWHAYVGEHFAKHTESLRLQDRKLCIKISSAALRHELNYAREKIRQHFAEVLPEAKIEEVQIR